MPVLDVLKENDLAWFRLEAEKSLDLMQEPIRKARLGEITSPLSSLIPLWRRIYYLTGFAGLISAAELSALAAGFLEQITLPGTVYSLELIKILQSTEERVREILDAVVLEDEEGHFVGSSSNVILTPRLGHPVPVEDLILAFRKWLIRIPEVSTMRKLRIDREEAFGHAIRIPPFVIRTRDRTRYLTLVYLDVSRLDSMDNLILRLADAEAGGFLLMQGPLEIPYDYFRENQVGRPFYLLLQTPLPAEDWMRQLGLEARIVRILKRPDPAAVRESEPKVILKEVPYTSPEVMKALENLKEGLPADGKPVGKEIAAGEQEERVGRIRTRFSIGFKMIFMISLIIVASLSLVTFISSSYFAQKNRKSLETEYLGKANILADSVREYFRNRIAAVNLLFLGTGSGDALSAVYAENFFTNNPDIIYISTIGEKRTAFFNSTYKQDITPSNLETLFVSEREALNRDALQLPYVFNPGYLFSNVDTNRVVVLGITAWSDVLQQPVLILVNGREFLRNNFSSGGLFSAYVVNNESQIIFHTEPEIISLSRSAQLRQIEDLQIIEYGSETVSTQKITDVLFNIGSNPTKQTAQAVDVYKKKNRRLLRLTVMEQDAEGNPVETPVGEFLMRKILGGQPETEENGGQVLEGLRMTDGKRDLNLILKNWRDIPIYRWLARQLDRNRINYFIYMKRIQGTEDYRLGVVLELEADRVNETVNQIFRWNILILLMVLSAAILLVYFFSKSLTVPIRKLVAAARKIEEGDYRLGLKIRGRDELGVLTGAFIDMGIGLEEKDRMKDAFGRFVNKEIADMAMKGVIGLGGERKQATVFFSDIRSFTAISEKLEPEEVVGFLNEYMTLMVDCVNRNKGVVDKFIGDAIMAVWGAPISHGNDEENCINAALEMRKVLFDFNRNRGGDKRPVIRIGCGINAGPVLAGQIGSSSRMEYTVIGDAVNLASRVESLNKPMGTDILITEQTKEVVGDIFDTVPMNRIKVKGKAEPQQIYAVLGRMDDPGRPRSLKELREMIGIQGNFDGIADVEEKEVKYEIIA